MTPRCFAWKVNTSFRQDGPALRVPSGTSRLVFSVSDCCVGSGTACSAQCSDEDVGITGDECHRVHSNAVFTFCAVRCDASNSQRTGGGNDSEELSFQQKMNLCLVLKLLYVILKCILERCSCHSIVHTVRP